jgi:hypothetical protein
MKTFIIIIVLLSAIGCTSQTERQLHAERLQNTTTKAVIIDSPAIRTTEGYTHKVKLIDAGVVAFVMLSNLYEQGDTVSVTKKAIIRN